MRKKLAVGFVFLFLLVLARGNLAFAANSFGHFAMELGGLPVFIYTMDEFQDRRALSPTSFGPSNDHWHLLGNGRLVALAYNHGEIVLYSGERGATWLNERDPAARRFAGGYGFLQEGNTIFSLRFPERPAGCKMERAFGVGYFQKLLRCPDLEITQTTYAPFGEETALISEVVVKNLSARPREFTWHEYWDYRPHFFGAMFETSEEGESTDKGRGLGALTPLVMKALKYFPGEYTLSRWVMEFLHSWRDSLQKDFLISTQRQGNVLLALSRHPSPPVKPADRAQVDYYPPAFFLAPLADKPLSRFETRRQIVFDKQGKFTGRLENGLVPETPRKKAEACLVIAEKISLTANESRTLHFVVGYAPKDKVSETVQAVAGMVKLEKLLPSEPATFMMAHLKAWRKGLPEIRTGLTWLDLEMLWHAYYLRAMATYDEYFQSRILSQGCAYQYVMGLNIAARDPLQHLLPVVYLEPALAKEVLRYTLSEMDEKGFIPYGIKGVGTRTGGGNPFPSDTNLYLMLALTEYVTATRDFAFLAEALPYYPQEAGRRGTVLEHMKRAYRHQIEDVGIGPHGLIKLRNSDWNDAFLAEEKTRDKKLDVGEVEREAESVLNTAMATYILPRFAGLVQAAGEAAWAEEVRTQAKSFREAVAVQWNCRWFNRALLPNGKVVGQDTLYLEPQPWAVLGGVLELASELGLLETMHAELSSRSPIGAVLRWPPLPEKEGGAEKPGMGTNGGVWYSLRMPLVMAYARLRPEYAWEEFVKMTLYTHAEAYPHTWIGVWSGPDSYNAPNSARPGETGDLLPFIGGMSDFPVMCGHAHAVPWFSLIKLLGIHPQPDGFTIDPRGLEGDFSFKTELVELSRQGKRLAGAITPLSGGKLVWRVRLPAPPVKALVDDKPVSVEMDGDFAVFATSVSAPGQRTSWSVEWP